MGKSMKYLWIYLAAVNVIAFFVYVADKIFAIKGMWRVPEKTLLSLAAVGGSAGALAAMYTVRHKTKHRQFTVGVPVMLAVQAVLVLWLLGII